MKVIGKGRSEMSKVRTTETQRVLREVIAWLRKKHLASIRVMREAAKQQNWSLAQQSEARAEAYSWSVLNVDAKLRALKELRHRRHEPSTPC